MNKFASIIQHAKNLPSSETKNEYLRSLELTENGKQQLTLNLIDEIFEESIDSITLELFMRVCQLNIHRNYLVKFLEMKNYASNHPIRILIGRYTNVELYFSDS